MPGGVAGRGGNAPDAQQVRGPARRPVTAAGVSSRRRPGRFAAVFAGRFRPQIRSGGVGRNMFGNAPGTDSVPRQVSHDRRRRRRQQRRHRHLGRHPRHRRLTRPERRVRQPNPADRRWSPFPGPATASASRRDPVRRMPGRCAPRPDTGAVAAGLSRWPCGDLHRGARPRQPRRGLRPRRRTGPPSPGLRRVEAAEPGFTRPTRSVRPVSFGDGVHNVGPPRRPASGSSGPQRLGPFPINSTPLPFQGNCTSVWRRLMPPG